MTDMAELVIRIKADAAQLESEMRKANGVVKQNAAGMSDSLKDLRNQFTALLPAISMVALVEFGRRAFEAADHINDLAQRIGIAGSTLSALNIPLRQGGSNLDEFSGAMTRLNNMIGEAAKGTNEEAVKAFDALGLSVRKLKQLSPEQQFYAVADALARVKDQGKLTESGMNLFGRSFATLIPLLLQAAGNMGAFVQKQKDLGNALTDDQLKRIDDLGDRWVGALERMKMQLLEVVPLVEKLAAVPEYLRAAFIEIPQQAGAGIGRYLQNGTANPRVSAARPDTVTEATFLDKGFGSLASKIGSATGSNAGLITPKENTLAQYIKDLQAETNALSLNEREYAISRAEIEASAKARADFKEKVRATSDTTDEEKVKVRELAGAFYDLKKAQEENARVAKLMKDALSDSLADIAVNFNSLRDTATSAIQAIAKEIIKLKITQPLSNSIIDSISGAGSTTLFQGFGSGAASRQVSSGGGLFSGLGKLLGFADGGMPPVGVPSIVGEHGPEIFVPNTAGTVISNDKIGGQTVHVTQNINVAPGVPELINAQIRQAAPQIAAAAHASVFAAMKRGGSESTIAGLRS